MRFLRFAVLLVLLSASSYAAVKAWETTITIPTYAAGEPGPMFYFGRNAQGAQGRVYTALGEEPDCLVAKVELAALSR